jgi:hypothetical protein
MDKNILNIIKKNKEDFVPAIFTSKQIDIISQYCQGKKLSNNERHILYTSIAKKVKALTHVYENEIIISGRDKMIESRIPKALELLREHKGKKAFIGGSFLFSPEYNDIDLFIIVEKGYREMHSGNLHTIFLSEKKLLEQIFQSAKLISISNFDLPQIKFSQPMKLGDIMSLYHESVIEIIDKEKREAARKLAFAYHSIIQNRVLDGKELKSLTNDIGIESIEKMTKELILRLFSHSYIYVSLNGYVNSLVSAMRTEKNENLKMYKNLYEEIMHEARRGKAEAA